MSIIMRFSYCIPKEILSVIFFIDCRTDWNWFSLNDLSFTTINLLDLFKIIFALRKHCFCMYWIFHFCNPSLQNCIANMEYKYLRNKELKIFWLKIQLEPCSQGRRKLTKYIFVINSPKGFWIFCCPNYCSVKFFLKKKIIIPSNISWNNQRCRSQSQDNRKQASLCPIWGLHWKHWCHSL